MQTENALRWVPIGCAVFLLFGPFGDRTQWGRGYPEITDSAGYNFTALFCGVVALMGLVIALRTRTRMILSVLGAMVSIAAFGVAAYACGTYWLALSRGEALLDGFAVMPARLTVYPAAGPPFFALAALIGVVSVLALAIGWLRQSSGI